MSLITVNIDGNDMPRIDEETFEVESIVGQVLDTCRFTIYDREANIVVPSMSDVIVTAERRGVTTRIFGGLAVTKNRRAVGPQRYIEVGCQDYTLLLDRGLIIQSYEANFEYAGLVGDKAILASAFEKDIIGAYGTKSTSEINARTDVAQGLAALSQQDFRYATLREVVSQLAQYVGFDFYVDFHKNLHYYYREDNPAPYILTDGTPSATAVNYRKPNHVTDGSRLVNTFALFGDRLLSDPQVYVLAGDGNAIEFDLSYDTIKLNYALLPEPGQSAIRVDTRRYPNKTLSRSLHDGDSNSAVLMVSSGSFVFDGVIIGDIVLNITDGSWGEVTALTETSITAVLLDGADNVWGSGDTAVIPQWDKQDVTNDVTRSVSGFDVQHDSIGKTLAFSGPPPNDSYAIRIRYAHNFVAGQVDTAALSVRRYGRVFSRRVVASDVNSAQGIIQKMAHLKEQYADALEKFTCTITDDMFPSTNYRRFEAGQWVRVINNVLDVDKEMLIHRVTTRILGAQIFEYEVELRDWEVDII